MYSNDIHIMPKNYVRKPKKMARKGKKTAKRLAPSSVKSVQAIVNKTIAGKVEDKEVYTQQFNTFFNSGINSSADCLQVIGNMSNGTGEAGRIGTKVTGKQITLRGHLITRFTGSTGTTYYNNCRVGVRMMIVQTKSYIGLGAIQANATTWQSTLLRRGATTVGFTGIIPDLYSKINTDAITVYYDKVFYVQNPYSNATLFSGGNNLLMPDGSTRFFNFSKKLSNKSVKYDPTIDGGVTPTNFNPVCILGYAYLDGSSADVVTTQIAMSYGSYFRYEDA